MFHLHGFQYNQRSSCGDSCPRPPPPETALT
jgi:hypothetical protein